MLKECNLQLSPKDLGKLESLKGQIFQAYLAQPCYEGKEHFLYNIGLIFDQASLVLLNDFVTVDFDGVEEYARFSVLEFSFLKKYIAQVDFVKTEIGEKIKGLTLVTDSIYWEYQENQFQYTCDVALVFELENQIITFQKNIWFSEEIQIISGKNYLDKLFPPDWGWDFEPLIQAQFSRQVNNVY